MFDLVKKLMAGPENTEMSHEEELRLAAAALLFRAVFVDGNADQDEIAMVERILEEEFGLSHDETVALMAEAKENAINASDHYGWTKRVNVHYSIDEKLYLMEKLWQVALADDHVDDMESAMMRRLAGLIYVTDADSALARQAAQN